MRRIRTDADNSSRSGPHRRVEKILDEMDISYLSEERYIPYTLDIFLPEWRLAIEIDGPLHNRTKDAVRDRWFLEVHGIPTLRLDAGWIRTEPVKTKITTFIEEHAETVETRKNAASISISST